MDRVQSGLLRCHSTSTISSNQEWIVHAISIIGYYDLRSRGWLVLLSMARYLQRNRSPSRSSAIITCATSIISFKIAELQNSIPGVLKASICCEPFKKIVSTAPATVLAFWVVLEQVARGVCVLVFLAQWCIVLCCMAWKAIVFILFNHVQAEAHIPMSQWMTTIPVIHTQAIRQPYSL